MKLVVRPNGKNAIACVVFCFFTASGFFTNNSQAQTQENPVWYFVFAYNKINHFPGRNYGCPYDNTSGSAPPETVVAYSYDRIITEFPYNVPTYRIDRSLFATYAGGRRMSDNYENTSCNHGNRFYGTRNRSVMGYPYLDTSDTITITFNQPVYGDSLDFRGKYPQRLIVTESGQSPVYVDLSPNPDYMNGGKKSLRLSKKKITSITIKSTDPDYSFSVGNPIVYRKPSNAPPRPGIGPALNYCGVNQITRPAPQMINSHDWTMNAEISDRDGLVLSNVRLKGRLMAERISVPYYKITTVYQNNTSTENGELRPEDAAGTRQRSRLVSYKPEINDEKLVIEAIYTIDNIASQPSCLNITQRYEFEREGANGFCTPPPPLGIGHNIPCSRWRAFVKYDFRGGNGETLQSLDVAQRNHFKVNGFAKNSVALFKDCDVPFAQCSPNYGLVFARKLNPLFTEQYSTVVADGQSLNKWDNVHQSYRGRISEPMENYLTPRFTAAGCPECVHSHWRWGRWFGERFNNGNIWLPSGTNQDLSFGIVRYKSGEEHPSSVLNLIDPANPEPIRTNLTGLDLINAADHYNFTVPEEVVYWLSAKGRKPSDEFFSYYSFFIGSEPNITRPISSGQFSSGLATSQEDKNVIPDSSQDAPTSVTYGFLYKDGTTTYTERDPNTVAPLPNGYAHYNNLSYDVRTEASVSGPHTVTFNVPSVTDQTTFDSLRVLHSESDPYDPTRAVWVDRTILPPNSPAPDFANRKIYAKVNEVGPFVIARFTPPPPNTNVADLSVSIIESADPVTAGNDLVYTVNVTNNGPHMATGVAFNNGLSPDVSFVSASAPQRFCRELNGTIACELSSIAPGVTIPVTITVQPNEGQTRFPPEGKAISNVAFVRGNETDPNPNDNSDTENTNALPNPNAPPTVKILSPADDSIFAGLATLNVIVEATDAGGSISQVELFINGESAGTGSRIPDMIGRFLITRSNVAFGEQSLIVVATDDGGRKAVSNPVRVFVNGPAIISLDNPVENSLFGRPASVALTTTATNNGGTVTQVEYFANGESLGLGALSGTNQYNLTWNNAPTGAHSLRAVATDGNGIKSYSDAAQIFVTNSPTVSIINPTSGASYAKPVNVALSANARDFDGFISKLEFFRNGALLGAATLVQADVYDFTWSNAPAGTHSITAVATDDWGKTSTSSPITITVTNVAPTVTMTSPTNGATFTAPANITLSANAADTDGTVTKVDFFNGTTLLGTATYAPFSYDWYGAIAGTHSLTAKATDDDNAATTSNPITITINPIGDALLVVGNTTLNGVDTAIRNRLRNLGFNVVIKSATAATSADANGKMVVVISDTVSPTNVNTKFRTVSIPVVTFDPQLFDDMGMTGTVSGTDFGTTASQRNVRIIDDTHPMAAGMSDTIQVTNSNTTFAWGKPNANAAKVAALTTDANKATSFGYETNAQMPGLTAPRRRVGFFYTASSSSLYEHGGALFDAAIRWAAGL